MSMPKTHFTYKICLFGDKQVGKTSLVNRFMTNQFDVDLKPTLGANIQIKNLELHNKSIKLQIWDFGGEERFHSLLKSYAYGSFGGIFMFDLTNVNSLNRVNDWLSIFRNSLDYKLKNIPILLVGGKSDLESNRVFFKEDITSLLHSLNFFDYVECSSKTGDNINYIFELLVKAIMETIKL